MKVSTFYLPYINRGLVKDSDGFSAKAQQFGYQIIDYKLPEVWSETQGEGIKIAVLDTGCQVSHPDLTGSFVSGSTHNRDEDGHGHGTHCCGIISGNNNNLGIVGVAPKVTLEPIKVLGDDGSGSFGGVTNGVLDAIDSGVDIITMSLGAAYNYRPLRDAIRKAYDLGIPTIAAAGNSGDKGKLDYPGNYPETISVGALDDKKLRAYFSQTGANLDFMAPGVSILSCVPGGEYQYMSGTCLPASELVYTKDGPVSISLLQKGDEVYSYNSDNQSVELNKVNKQWSNGDKKIRKIYTNKTSSRCTDNHPILTLERNGKGKENNIAWKRADQIIEGDFVISSNGFESSCSNKDISISDNWSVRLKSPIKVTRQDVRNKNIDLSVNLDTAVAFLNSKHGLRYQRAKSVLEAFNIKRSDLLFGSCGSSGKFELPEFVDENLAYLLGFYLGDGWISEDNRNKSENSNGCKILYFAKGEHEELNIKIRKMMAELFLVELADYNGQFICRHTAIADIFSNLTCKEKAKDKFLPDWIYLQPKIIVNSFISGLLDADGYSKRNNTFGFSSCSKRLTEGLACLCDYYGIRRNNVSYRQRVVHPPNSHEPIIANEYSLTLSFDNSATMAFKKHSSFIMQEDYSGTIGDKCGLLLGCDVKLDKVTKIDECDGVEEVFDIEVEGNHNFITNNIVVHNSMATPWLAGVLALIIAKHRTHGGETPVDTVEQMREHLKRIAVDLEGVGKDSHTGWGLIDVGRAIDIIRGTMKIIVSQTQFDAPGKERDNLNEEWVEFKNIGTADADMVGWNLTDNAGRWNFVFPDGFKLGAGKAVKVRTGTGNNTDTDLYWGFKRAIWNNTGDIVRLSDVGGKSYLEFRSE